MRQCDKKLVTGIKFIPDSEFDTCTTSSELLRDVSYMHYNSQADMHTNHFGHFHTPDAGAVPAR